MAIRTPITILLCSRGLTTAGVALDDVGCFCSSLLLLLALFSAPLFASSFIFRFE